MVSVHEARGLGLDLRWARSRIVQAIVGIRRLHNGSRRAFSLPTLRHPPWHVLDTPAPQRANSAEGDEPERNLHRWTPRPSRGSARSPLHESPGRNRTDRHSKCHKSRCPDRLGTTALMVPPPATARLAPRGVALLCSGLPGHPSSLPTLPPANTGHAGPVGSRRFGGPISEQIGAAIHATPSLPSSLVSLAPTRTAQPALSSKLGIP